MKNSEVIKMLEGFVTLDETLIKAVIQRTIDKANGGAMPEVDGCTGCSGQNGCSHTTKNGDCECVNNVCTWIPLIG